MQADPRDWNEAPAWRTVAVNGGVLSEERVAAMSGPRIFVVVTTMMLLLGLSVLWRGDPSTTAAGFWPPAGAALVAMLVLPARRWGWVMMAILVPTAIGICIQVVPLGPALWWGSANCLEPAIGAAVLRRCRTATWLTRGRLMMVFLAGAVVLAPMIGAAVGSVGTVIGYGRPWHEVWGEWIVGDGLGVLAVVPLLMTYTSRGPERHTRREMVAIASCIAMAIALTFADVNAASASLLPYVILSLMIWAGMRFGTRAAAATAFLVAEAANLASSVGIGPFAVDGSQQTSPITLQIFLAIALVLSFVVAAMASDLANGDEVNRLLRYQATHDALTGLPNRLRFSERLQAAIESRHATGATAVLLIDLDDFKTINDRHGHPTGDEVLTVIAAALRANVRPQDLLARLGGDEFVVVCENIDGPDAARSIAVDVLNGLDNTITVRGHDHRVRASVGIALTNDDNGDSASTAIDLLRRADIALYHSKRTGDVTVSLFDAAMDVNSRRRAELEEELEHAVRRGELHVAYQPIVSLTTGCVEKFEALLRWQSARFGPVGPDEFIPIAEDSGLIIELGDWVLEAACREAAGWRNRPDTPHPPRIAVNVSALQLCDRAFPDRVRAVLERAGLHANGLVLEITETALMDDLDVSSRVLTTLRTAGVRMSMDDFGTGYSSMTYLRRFPVDSLKIDRSFIHGLGVVPEDTAIVASIVALGHSFGIDVIAEGVEDIDQAEHLLRLGCDQGQGYLWSRAVDPSTAATLTDHRFDVLPRQLAVAAAHPHRQTVAEGIGA